MTDVLEALAGGAGGATILDALPYLAEADLLTALAQAGAADHSVVLAAE